MKSSKTFYTVGSILLLFFIAGLLALMMNKNVHPRPAIKRAFLSAAEKIKAGRWFKFKLPARNPASATAQSFLRLEDSVLVDPKRQYVFHPKLRLRGRNEIIFNTVSGAVFKFDAKLRAVTGSAANDLDQATALIPIGSKLLMHDRLSRFFLVDPAEMNVSPFFLYAGGRPIFGLAGVGDANADGTPDIVVADSMMQVACVDGRDFTTRWSFADASDLVLFAPVSLFINNDRAADFAFASQNGILYGLDGRSGWVLWKQPVQEAVKSQVYAVDINSDGETELLFSSEEKNLFCYSRLGSGLWKLGMGSKVKGLVFGDLNGDGRKDIVVSLENNAIVCLNGITQLKLWDFVSERPIDASTLSCFDVNADRRSDVVFSDTAGVVTCVDGATGNIIGRLPIPERPVSEFVPSQKGFYFLTADGHMDLIRFYEKK